MRAVLKKTKHFFLRFFSKFFTNFKDKVFGVELSVRFFELFISKNAVNDLCAGLDLPDFKEMNPLDNSSLIMTVFLCSYFVQRQVN